MSGAERERRGERESEEENEGERERERMMRIFLCLAKFLQSKGFAQVFII